MGVSPPESCKSHNLLIPITRTHFSNVETGIDLVNKSARLSEDFVCKVFYLTTLLEFVRIKQLRSNILRDVALYVACLQSNTSIIILIDNGR